MPSLRQEYLNNNQQVPNTGTKGLSLRQEYKLGYTDGAPPATPYTIEQYKDGSGQFLVDTKTGQPFKSDRPLTGDQAPNGYWFRDRLRSGLPASLAQPDHIIPIALYGADTPDNIQVLGIKDHDIKTKVGAVAQELYWANKISLDEARSLVLDWRGKNVKGLELNDKGRLSVDDAAQKYAEWQLPPKTTFKDIWNKFRKTPTGEFTVGLADELAFGFLPEKQVEYDNKNEAVVGALAQGAGRLVGTLASFGLVYGVATKALRLALGTEKILEGGKEIARVKNIPRWLKTIRDADTAASVTVGGIKVPANRAYRAIQNAGLFTLHGQLSKQDEAGIEARVKRFATDAAMGGLLALPGNSLRSYGGLAAGAYAFSALTGADEKESFLNAAIMVGLHGLGHKGRAKVMQSMADDAAVKQLQKWGMNAKVGEVAEEDFLKLRGQISNKIFQATPTPEAYREEMTKTIIAARQLYKGGLAFEKRIAEDIADFKSLFKRNATRTEESIRGIPSGTNNLFNQYRSLPLEGEAEGRIGIVKTTGYGKDLENNYTNQNVVKAVENGQVAAGDRVVFIRRTDKDFVDLMKAKGVKEPENAVEAFATGKDGKVYSLGFWPTQKRISDPKTGINQMLISYNLPSMDPKMDNNYIIKRLEQGKGKAITGKIFHITSKAENGHPSVTIKVAPNDYASIGRVSQLLEKQQTRKEIQQATKAIKEAPKPTVENVRELTVKDLPQRSGRGFFLAEMWDFGGRRNNPADFTRYLGTQTSKTISRQDASKVKTVGDLMDFLAHESNSGRLTTHGRTIYDAFSPYYQSLSQAEKVKISKLLLPTDKPQKPIQEIANFKRTGQIEQKLPLEEPAKTEPPIKRYIKPTAPSAPPAKPKPNFIFKKTKYPERSFVEEESYDMPRAREEQTPYAPAQWEQNRMVNILVKEKQLNNVEEDALRKAVDKYTTTDRKTAEYDRAGEEIKTLVGEDGFNSIFGYIEGEGNTIFAKTSNQTKSISEVLKNKEYLGQPKTIAPESKALAEKIRKGLSSKDKRVKNFNRVLDESLRSIYGDYENNPSVVKDWEKFLKFTTSAPEERQRKDIIAGLAKYQKLGKNLTAEEKRKIYGSRKAQAERESEALAAMKNKPTSKNLSEQQRLESEALALGMRTTGTETMPDDFLDNLTHFDMIMKNMRRSEIDSYKGISMIAGKTQTPKEAAEDAAALIWNFMAFRKKYLNKRSQYINLIDIVQKSAGK